MIILSLVAGSPATAQNLSDAIWVNQVGFYTGGPKVAAVTNSSGGAFSVRTSDLAREVFVGSLGPENYWAPAQRTVRLADFSALSEPGSYVLVVPGLGRSYPFVIGPAPHQSALRAAIKSYYFQRASTALHRAHADGWARAAGHPDLEVLVHPSAASETRPAMSTIAAPKGWYDAGDYNKYIVNSGITTGTLLMLLEHFPSYFAGLDTDIPESTNGVPDLLDEILWNVRWMMAMQDPADGGVYTKLTTANFEGFVMPSQARAPRYVVKKSTPAALNFAAVAALAARRVGAYPQALPGLADSLLAAAGAAWNWARAHRFVTYNQGELNAAYEPDIHTGAYGDTYLYDEFRWAAAELFLTTRQDSFVVQVSPLSNRTLTAPSWQYVDPLALISLAFHAEAAAQGVDTTAVREKLLGLADLYMERIETNALGTVMGSSAGDFYWGSNSLAANQGTILMQAYRMTSEPRYLRAAIANLDYLMGRNATGFCFLTGFGDRSPLHPHHRPSEADGIADPVPGLLVGGPNANREDGCAYPSTLAAMAYVDDVCSYASNENAINWNAAFAYLAGAIEATLSPTGLPTASEPADLPAHRGPHSLETYPNPASDVLNVRVPRHDGAAIMVELVDMLGRVVRRSAADSAAPVTVSLSTSALPAGSYLLRLRTDSGVTVGRIAVAH